MKVLHIVGNKIESSNGIGRLLPEMVEMQNKYGNYLECTLCCINDDYSSKNFNVINKNEISDNIFDEFDLFIFHGLYFYPYIKMSKKILSRGKKYLIKPHSSLINAAQKKSIFKKTVANILFFKRFVMNADSLIFTNEDEDKNSIQWNPNKTYEGNGISSIQKMDWAVRIKEKPYKFVYLSRIDFNHKGTDLLLDALQLLKDKYGITNLNLSIYGKGNRDEEDELIRRIENLSFPDVTFSGPIYGKEKFEMFHKKDFFILTSRYEGFPMAILEALDSGLPCIVTKGVNMTSIIERHKVGWECDITVKGIAELIISVLKVDATLINNMSSNARKYIIEEHDWPSLVKISESIYADAYKRNM